MLIVFIIYSYLLLFLVLLISSDIAYIAYQWQNYTQIAKEIGCQLCIKYVKRT